ncbi:MAG: arginase family protein [Acidobacteria bacterium]|nr:arginase family protein [Acidobacteriota bacterium]
MIAVTTIRQSGIAEALNLPLRTLRSRGPRIYLHFDLDVLDPTRAPGNEFAAPGGHYRFPSSRGYKDDRRAIHGMCVRRGFVRSTL